MSSLGLCTIDHVVELVAATSTRQERGVDQAQPTCGASRK